MNNSPIGIFDSGLGGLTVLKEVRSLLPSEDLIYLGDTARVPYGNKSQETVEKYSLEISRFLADQGVKMIIIACNSASSLGIDAVRREIDLPLLGVIDPGARTAVKSTRNGKIGVIGTRGTIKSGAYQRALAAANGDLNVSAVPTPLLVPLVEEGWSSNAITKQVLNVYLKPLREKGIDTLILGCTHYPFLKDIISEVMGTGVSLVDSAEALAKETKKTLADNDRYCAPSKTGSLRYFTTDSPEIFINIGGRLTNLDLSNTEQVIF